MRRAALAIVMIIALQRTTVLAAADERAAFDAKTFESLTPAEKIDFTLGVLRWRESQLRNFSYALKSTTASVQANQPDPPFADSEVSVLRLADTTLVHSVENLKGKRVGEFIEVWDGATSRVQNVLSDGMPLGKLSHTQTSQLRNIYYNDILGLRIIGVKLAGAEADMTRSEWFDYEVNKLGRTVEVKVEQVDGSPLIKVHLETGKSYYNEFWLDPQRDYMAVKEEYQAKYGNDSGYRRTKVEAARQAEGLWVPTEVSQRRSISASDGRDTEYHYVVAAFSRGTVHPADLTLTYPAGTVVLDMTGDVETMFKVMKDGTKKMLPHRDSRTGLINDGHPETPEKVFAAARTPFPSQSRWTGATIVWAGAVAALLAAICMVWLLRRRDARHG